MNWITQLPLPGHISEALVHYNHATDLLENGAENVEISRILFDALNKIQTEWLFHQERSDKTNGEVKTFQTMVLEGLDEKSQQSVLQSDELKDFVNFEPQIMDHSRLNENDYRPEIAIDPEIRKNASKIHHKLHNAYESYLSGIGEGTQQRVLKKGAELLYIVRSNIAHGEKTSYGPDINRIERDENVCRVVIPLQKTLLYLMLDSPEHKLVVYGTLAPGEVNHRVISNISGTWEDCTVNGSINMINGLPTFVWNPNGPTQDVQLFSASELPAWWERLDRFEGSYYQRILVPVRTCNGLSIANCYQFNGTSFTKKY